MAIERAPTGVQRERDSRIPVSHLAQPQTSRRVGYRSHHGLLLHANAGRDPPCGCASTRGLRLRLHPRGLPARADRGAAARVRQQGGAECLDVSRERDTTQLVVGISVIVTFVQAGAAGAGGDVHPALRPGETPARESNESGSSPAPRGSRCDEEVGSRANQAAARTSASLIRSALFAIFSPRGRRRFVPACVLAPSRLRSSSS